MFFSLLNDFLFIKTCVSCQSVGSYLCNNCKDNIELIDLQRCLVCDQYSINGKTHKYCKKHYIPEAIISSFTYSKTVKKIILRSKTYQNSYTLLNQLLLHKKVKKDLNILFYTYKIDVLTYVPMKQVWGNRIKNHSKIIADYISTKYNRPVVNLLNRKTSIKQKELSRDLRFEKSRNVFEFNSGNLNKFIKDTFCEYKKKELAKSELNILITDDIATTGATLISATKTLKQHLPKSKIYCYTLSKDLRYNSIRNVT